MEKLNWTWSSWALLKICAYLACATLVQLLHFDHHDVDRVGDRNLHHVLVLVMSPLGNAFRMVQEFLQLRFGIFERISSDIEVFVALHRVRHSLDESYRFLSFPLIKILQIFFVWVIGWCCSGDHVESMETSIESLPWGSEAKFRFRKLVKSQYIERFSNSVYLVCLLLSLLSSLLALSLYLRTLLSISSAIKNLKVDRHNS